MNQTQTTGHTAAAFFYDLRHETLRKQQLERLMSRSWDQVAEETQLKADLKKIEEKRQDLRQVSLGVASLAVSDGAALDPSKKAPKKLKHKDQDSKSVHFLAGHALALVSMMSCSRTHNPPP
eukprot:m.109374 g.109374  ORF g.109374 m.109374 type:complete len:122 (-) comp51764_c0_seq1:444-809(-)